MLIRTKADVPSAPISPCTAVKERWRGNLRGHVLGAVPAGGLVGAHTSRVGVCHLCTQLDYKAPPSVSSSCKINHMSHLGKA